MTMETTPTLLQDTRVIDNGAYNYFTYYLNHGRYPLSFLSPLLLSSCLPLTL